MLHKIYVEIILYKYFKIYFFIVLLIMESDLSFVFEVVFNFFLNFYNYESHFSLKCRVDVIRSPDLRQPNRLIMLSLGVGNKKGLLQPIWSAEDRLI